MGNVVIRRSTVIYLALVAAITVVATAGPESWASMSLVASAYLTMVQFLRHRRRCPPSYETSWRLRTLASGAIGTGAVWLNLQRYWVGGPTAVASGGLLLMAVGQVALFASLLSLVVRRGLPGRGQRTDLGVIAVGIAVPVGQLVVGPLIDLRREYALTAVYLAGTAIAHAAALVVIVWLALTVGGRLRMLNLIAASTACLATSSLIIAVLQGNDPSRGLSRWSILSIIASDLLVGLAAVLGPGSAPRPHRARHGFGPGRMVALVVALCLPTATSAVAYRLYGTVSIAGMVLPTIVMAGLVVVRARHLYQQSERAAAATAAKEKYFRALVQHVSDVVVVTDPDGRLVDHTAAFDVAFGTPGAEGSMAALLARPSTASELLTEAALSAGRAVTKEIEAIDATGRARWFEASVADMTQVPEVAGYVWVLRDIDERRQFVEQLRHQALHDSLTGLPNRVLLSDRLHTAIARARRQDTTISVLFVDLDNFKLVNDSLGHAAGDALLQGVAARLAVAVRDHDTVARLGGDEFAVVVEHASPGHAADVADRVLAALEEPIDVGGAHVPVTCSIGVATGTPDVPEDLLRDADLAMYHAKAAGKNTARFFDPVMHAAASERMQLELDLADAVAGEALFLVYQPVIALATKQATGFEALVRWRHPVRGLVSPADFIPLAESTGLIVQIGRFVLDRACRQAATWPAHVQIAVNVSAVQLEHERFIDDVAEALAAAGLEPDRLVLELTESAVVRDVGRANAQLAALKGLGVRIAIDDFGTGYSSLSQLRSLPIDILKIDRSFINAMHTGPSARAVVQALIDMGSALNLETIAEGVEDPEQAMALRDSSCTEAQGFLYARPLDALATHRFIAEHEVLSMLDAAG
jgi:diguanylate cyclase (GGDEF)-like protein/PAS domain S-box-containing protein